MDMLCDLHTHSLFSDGSFTPAEIIDGAIEKKLSAVALTDHNTVGGLPDFLSYAEWKDIEAVAGAEFSVDYNGKELHLLGLFIPYKMIGLYSPDPQVVKVGGDYLRIVCLSYIPTAISFPYMLAVSLS